MNAKKILLRWMSLNGHAVSIQADNPPKPVRAITSSIKGRRRIHIGTTAMPAGLISILSLIISFVFLHICSAQEGAEWNVEKSSHFIVYYKEAPEDFIKHVIGNSENYYHRIASDLGFNRYNFWLWDERAKVYIYNNILDYQVATGQPFWSGGNASVKDKIISSFPYAHDFFETVLAHEMGHIIFREFVGFDNNAVPLWLDEGVASYQERSKYSQADTLVREAIGSGKFIPLEKLPQIGEQFSMPADTAQLFYTESFSAVDFLIKKFGKDKFVTFCQSLRDKKSMDRALASSYSFSDVGQMQEAWKKYLEN